MNYKGYPSDKEVSEHIKAHEPLIIAIAFDESEILVSRLDDSFEHHILLSNFEKNPNDIDKYFRIIVDNESAEWTFVCPPDYLGISDRKRRITRFYNDGITAISKVLSGIEYFSDITIPKRYRRHFEALGDDSTYLP